MSRANRLPSWPLLLAGLLAGASQAAPYPNVYGAPPEVLRGTDWYRQCLRVKNERPAPPPVEEKNGNPRCDAGALYYDTLNLPDANKADWQRVHACAARTNAHGVLMMLHANGAVAPPKFDLALQHACSIQSPVDEMKSRVEHLRRRASGEDRAPVDVCDDAAADMRGQCAATRERQRDKTRSSQLEALTRGWNAKEQLGLEIASKASHHFAQHRVDYETDASGNATRSLQLDAQAAELDRFAQDVMDAEAGKTPRFTEAEFAILDEKMNATYRQFMLTRPASTSYLGTIRKGGVEKSQQAWLAYRDAMELFGAIRHPQVPGASWRALLTARRITQLTELDNAAAGK